MIAETIFYITGSIFFVISILILLAIGIYLVKILQAFLKISAELKNTAVEIKSKVASFYLGFAGLSALLEKLIELKREKQEKKKEKEEKKESDVNEEEEKEEEKNFEKKDKKIKKIKVVEITQE